MADSTTRVQIETTQRREPNPLNDEAPMLIHAIPRTSVRALTSLARIPLTAAQRVAHPDDVATWPPTLAFDAAEATVTRVVGTLVRDREMAERGRLLDQRVTELREAERLAATAQRTRADAELSFEERRAADQERARAADERAQERADRAERDAEKARREADARASRKLADERRKQDEAAASIARKARSSRSRDITEEKTAVRKGKAAAAAAADVQELDEEIRATKAVRRSRR